MATPFIRPINEKGGSFYTFSSASRDLVNSFNDDSVKFQFSKFALLNLPNIKTPTNNQNFIQFDTVDGAINSGINQVNDLNVALATHLQNYALNFEEILIRNGNIDDRISKSPAERVFWKWLKEIGAIRFRSTNSETESLTSNRFAEEFNSSEGAQQYSRVVEYIGDIQLINNVKSPENAFTQLNIYIPTKDGNTPLVLFKTLSDENYKQGEVYTGSGENLEGRDSFSVHPSGLDTFAFYDFDTPNNWDNSQNAQWWGPALIPNSYFTEQDFNNPSSELRSLSSLDYSAPNFNGVTYLRSKLDGICIDFDPRNYAPIQKNAGVQTIPQFNSTLEANDFEFNTVLVYYDVFDPSNPTVRATSLYGVLFLDNVKTNGSEGGFIQRFPKNKLNPITKLNGNSFSLDLNIKFDTTVGNPTIESTVNDYSAYSMTQFSESAIEFQRSSEILQKAIEQYSSLVSRIDYIENRYLNTSQIRSLESRVSSLESSFVNSNLLVSDIQQVLDLIDVVNQKIESILNGTAPVELQYNTDVVSQSLGIKVDKTVPNKILIENSVQQENSIWVKQLDYSFQNRNVLEKGPFSTLIYETTENPALLDNLILRIDDSVNQWKTGQSYKIKFNFPISPSIYVIEIFTDSIGQKTGAFWGKQIKQIPTSVLSQLTGQFEIQIVCIDSSNFIFDTRIVPILS